MTGERRPMPALEFHLWREFRSKFGFDIDRLEWAVANGASAQCHAWGSRVNAEDVVAKFGERPKSSKRKLLTDLSNLQGAVVMFIPKDPNKMTLTGVAALEEFERAEDAKRERRQPRTLDQKTDKGKKTDREPRRRTLGGD